MEKWGFLKRFYLPCFQVLFKRQLSGIQWFSLALLTLGRIKLLLLLLLLLLFSLMA